MNRKVLIYLLVITLVIANAVPVLANSEYSLSISTNANRVKMGSSVLLTGTVLRNNNPDQGIVVTIKVQDSQGTSITYVDQIETDENGSFEVAINVDSMFYKYGWYTIYVKAAGIEKTATFEVYRPNYSSGSSGGSSGGGAAGSSGDDDDEQVKKTVQGKATVIKDEDGNITVLLEIDNDKIEDKIENEKSDKVEIDAVIEEGADEITVSMDAELISKINDRGKKLIIKTEEVIIQIDPNSFDVEERTKINFKVNKLDKTKTKEFVSKIESNQYTVASNILDLELTSEKDGEKSKVQFKKSVAVSINYDKSKVKDKRKLGAYYYNEELGKWEYVGGKADAEGNITFTVDHFSKYTAMEYNKTFADIDIPWAKDAIEVLAARHVIDGVDGEHYLPNNNISRAAFAKLLVKALNLKSGDKVVTFTDVAEGQWYTEPVNIASSLGIVKGYDGKFNPNGEITREAMATMIVRTLKYVKPDGDYTLTATTFEDIDEVSDWAKEAVKIAYNKGIVNGVSETTFAPKAKATRGHAAVMVYRLLEELGLL